MPPGRRRPPTVKRHKQLFAQVASLANLLEASRDAVRGKRSKPVAARYLVEMEKEVLALHQELHSGGYRHGPYTYFTIYEPKARVVAAAGFRDRVVQGPAVMSSASERRGWLSAIGTPMVCMRQKHCGQGARRPRREP